MHNDIIKLSLGQNSSNEQLDKYVVDNAKVTADIIFFIYAYSFRIPNIKLLIRLWVYRQGFSLLNQLLPYSAAFQFPEAMQPDFLERMTRRS
jgi:hypothetical protein